MGVRNPANGAAFWVYAGRKVESEGSAACLTQALRYEPQPAFEPAGQAPIPI